MLWVPLLFGVFKLGVVGVTVVLCVKSQREGERDDRRRKALREERDAAQLSGAGH